MVTRLGLETTQKGNLSVKVADGKQINCACICVAVPTQLEEHLLHVDLFVPTLGEFDVIMGVNRLQTLGNIEWDFNIMKIEFLWDGEHVSWQGESTLMSTTRNLAAKLLEDAFHSQLQYLLGEYDRLFEGPR